MMPPLPTIPLVAAMLFTQSPEPPASTSVVVAAEPNAQSAPAPPSIAPVAPLSWAIFAQDPLVQDPVSFCVADDGSLFIAESFRQEKGVEDNGPPIFGLMMTCNCSPSKTA